MAVSLADLQLIYSKAGARDQFEELVGQLVAGEFSNADKVREKSGDGGIDVFVGQFTSAEGIDVYQCKFFPEGLGQSQKQQIRDSFKNCTNDPRFKVKQWTLCLPINLSIDEIEWFSGWKDRQAASGVLITEPWGAMKLEGLLYQDKNKGLKEAFFREEFVTQIRELHAQLQRDDAERLRLVQKQLLVEQTAVIDKTMNEVREIYLSTAMQCASTMGLIHKKPSHWEIIIHPSNLPPNATIDSFASLWTLIQSCLVGSDGWVFPPVTHDFRHQGGHWIGWLRSYNFEVQTWRLYDNCLFISLFPIQEDVIWMDKPPDQRRVDFPRGFVPQHYFSIKTAIRILTHTFRFASHFAEKILPSGDGMIDIAIALGGAQDRVLLDAENRIMPDCYRAHDPCLKNKWTYSRHQLQAEADALAIRAAVWFFERFGWLNIPNGILQQIQSSIFMQSRPTA